jgi:hypothetical protein
VPASVTFKQYLIDNQTGQTMTVKYSATAGVAVETGKKARVQCDGTTVVRAPGQEVSGPWTAGVRGSGTAGTYEIGTQFCRYTRIGRRVWLDVYINFAGAVTGGGTGDLNVTGVPFAKVANTFPIGTLYTNGLDFTTSGASLTMQFSTTGASSTLFIKENVDNSAGNNLPISGVSASDTFYGSICYETDDP